MRRLIPWIILLLLITGGGTASWLWRDMKHSLQLPLNISTPETLIIQPGATLTRISRDLVDRGWLEQPHYLNFEARRRGLARSIQAGEYAIQPGTTPLDLLHLVVSGKVIQHSITLLEGWTFRQFMFAIMANDRLSHTLTSHDPVQVMNEIGHAGHFAEGRLFPDTYFFPSGTTDIEILQRAYQTMESVLREEWARRREALPYASEYEALIMASLIEKETAVPEERAEIAGVFVRRLERGINLQTDPAVIYGMGEAFDGNIRRADLQRDSPYNTYLRTGLPPTPIASPGRAAIRAALQPKDGDYLYFVARGDGSHYFASTLDDHNQAVRKYQLQSRM